ncbi:8538_t:CDS:2 [Gigaspora margarita]|uniref:8538_t:CDS:1 n=1 Tax=Gigaspora margarita TaxID=4874 RepID=A0ABM8W266_GIGMA|nr:8538_t:CDS:2 [Gigaspora margarita]
MTSNIQPYSIISDLQNKKANIISSHTFSLDSSSSGCVVLTNFLKELNIAIDHPFMAVIIGVHAKVNKKPEEDLSISEEVTKSKINKSNSNEEYENEVLRHKVDIYIFVKGLEYETIYQNEEKEKEDFNLEPMTTQHEVYIEDGPQVKQKFYFMSKSEYEFIKTKIQHIEKAVPGKVKVRTVKEFPLPKTLRAHRGFLELASFYRRFMKDFAKIAALLLKMMLVTVPVLVHSNDNKEYILYTNTLHLSLRAVLAQPEEHKKEHVNEYSSRSTSIGKSNYVIIELECIAVR